MNTRKTFLLMLSIAVVLILMRFIPTFSIYHYESRPVDMLSELTDTHSHKDGHLLSDSEKGSSLADTLEAPKTEPYHPEGVVLFEDFSNDEKGGLNHIWDRLLHSGDGGYIHIAYFGDSFIESDILTCDLRELLQTEYGGSGPGWVDCGGGVGTNKPTINSKRDNITENCILRKPFDVNLENLNQRYYHASNGASLHLSATSYKKHSENWNCATLFLSTDVGVTIKVSGDSIKENNYQFDASDEVQALTVKGTTTRLDYTFPNATSKTRLFGVSLDGLDGVTLDNFSMRGTPGFMLSKIPVKTMSEMNKYRPYDLIIIQFGLNVVNDKATDEHCRAYIDKMKEVIEHFKQGFPQASIAVFSVSDRTQRSSSGFHTLRGVEKLVDFQRTLAKECEVGFLNIHQIMGGNDSMNKFVEEGLAAKDYTHLNYKGGRFLQRKSIIPF